MATFGDGVRPETLSWIGLVARMGMFRYPSSGLVRDYWRLVLSAVGREKPFYAMLLVRRRALSQTPNLRILVKSYTATHELLSARDRSCHSSVSVREVVGDMGAKALTAQ